MDIGARSFGFGTGIVHARSGIASLGLTEYPGRQEAAPGSPRKRMRSK